MYFLFLSIRFDSNAVTEETPVLLPREVASPVAKASKGTKARDVSFLSFFFSSNYRLMACVCNFVRVPLCVLNNLMNLGRTSPSLTLTSTQLTYMKITVR